MADIIELEIETKLDIHCDKVLNGAIGELDQAIVIGKDKKGEMYFATSIADIGTALYLVERFKQSLLE